MSEPLVLPTERETVKLRQLAIEDAPAYFEAVDVSREHLSQFGDVTAFIYPDLQAVKTSLTDPSNPSRLRMGIWAAETFVGSINLTPDEEGAEIGYWLDSRHTGHGYATLATKALSAYAAKRYSNVHAEVVKGNDESKRVLERAGFKQLTEYAGSLLFELAEPHIKGSTDLP